MVFSYGGGVLQVVVTAVATLFAVVLGGWLTIRGQDRLWRRDNQRQWRDIRLKAYTDFLTAMREFVAYLLTPSAVVTAVARQSGAGDDMPFFDDHGTRHKERLEATKTAIRLIAGTTAVVDATDVLTITTAIGGKLVVDRLNLAVNSGERVALVGESGSGKTVSALSVLRLLPHAQVTGRILFRGEDLLTKQAYGNEQFLRNALDFLLDDSNLMELRNRNIEARLLDRQRIDEEKNEWQWFILLLPLAIIGALGGIFYWWRKRKFAK